MTDISPPGLSAERELQNSRYLIHFFETDFVCVSIYRGELSLQEDGSGIVRPGDGLVVEVYDRCTTMVWFDVTQSEMAYLASLFEAAAA